MYNTVKAKVINGILTPLEPFPVPLEEGVEYRLTLVDTRPASEWPVPKYDEADRAAFRATAGVWKDEREYWEEFLKTIYAAREAGTRPEPNPQS